MVRLGWPQCLAVAVCLLVVRTQLADVMPIPMDIPPAPTAASTKLTPTGISGVTPPPTAPPPINPVPKPTPTTPTSAPPLTEIPADVLPGDRIKPNSAAPSAALKIQPTPPPPTNPGYAAYLAATTAFTALNTAGGGCTDNYSVLKGVSFRQHNTKFYLTADSPYYLSLKKSESPTPSQLFTAKQNADCTWSFRTPDGLYISLTPAFTYLTLSSQLSATERFYMERSKDWIYVESANSYRYFWMASNGIVMYALNSAARFVMEVWPTLNVGWN